tara:strand:- start:133 stop:804 length:672 start_codon:yes stop_codon:yes gene_type:complete
MSKLNAMRLKLLLQQEHQRITESQKDSFDLSLVQARGLCWLTLLTEAHEDQANDAEKRGDTEQAMGWYADSQRLRDVINLVSNIEVPFLEEINDVATEHGISNSYLSVKDQKDSYIVETYDASSQNEIPEYLGDIKTKVDTLETKIDQLLKIIDQRLVEQIEIDQKLSEKIKQMESLSGNLNNSKNNKYIGLHNTQTKTYKNHFISKESSQWINNNKRVLYGK